MKKTEKKKVIINADEAYHHIYDIKWTKREEKLMRLGFAKSRIYLGRYLTEYWQTPQEELYAELLSNEFREKLKKKKAKAYTKGYSEGYLKKEQEIKQNPRLGMTATEIGMINKNLRDMELLAQDFKDIVWMARRYAEGRHTGAPEIFNRAYDRISKFIDFDEKNDPDNRFDDPRPIKNFPYATKGQL